MATRRAGLATFVMLTLVLAACNRNQSQQATNSAPPPAPAEPAPVAQPPAAPEPPSIPPGTETAVNSVDSVSLNRPADAPEAIIIHVSGMTSSMGWTDPKLAQVTEEGSDPSIAVFRFVATSPQNPDAGRVAQPVEAELRVASLPPEVKTIRIVSASNEVTAPIAQ
ncbi:MAG TPA: hypothetical protein VEU06_02100 [Micropepsaceae bacterium]|nr:hypothetical protein [Micropepsaceae bacterium]